MLGKKWGHPGIVHRQDGDGEAAVDLSSKVSEGEVMVKGGEFRVFGKYLCYVMCVGGGGGKEEEEEGDGQCGG